MRSEPIEDRFHKKYIVDPDTGCWLWQACRITGGYGMMRARKGEQNQLAHRLAWRIYVGEIPADKTICHRCDHRACVNPEHLFLGDQGENMKDMERKGRARILSEENVRDAQEMFARGMSLGCIARQLGVDRMTVTRALERAEIGIAGPKNVTGGQRRPYTMLRDGHKRAIEALLDSGYKILWIAECFDVDRKTVRNIRDKVANPSDPCHRRECRGPRRLPADHPRIRSLREAERR